MKVNRLIVDAALIGLGFEPTLSGFEAYLETKGDNTTLETALQGLDPAWVSPANVGRATVGEVEADLIAAIFDGEASPDADAGDQVAEHVDY